MDNAAWLHFISGIRDKKDVKMDVTHLISLSTTMLECSGILVIALGILVFSAAAFARFVRNKQRQSIYEDYRRQVGRSILLGLELLIAADIIRTVAIKPTLLSVGVLAGVVAIRTFLSFTLELEISGHWPWQNCSK